MPWFIFAIVGVTVNALSHVLRRRVMSHKHKLDYYTSSYLFSFSTSVALLIYVSIGTFVMPPIGDFLIIFLINITAGVVAWLTNNRGLSLIGLSEYSIVMTSRQVVTWVTSVMFLGIGLSYSQGIGSLIILAGIVIVFLNKQSFKHNSKSGLVYTFITAIIYGTAILTDQIIYRDSDPASFLLIGFIINTILLAAIKPSVVSSTKLLVSKKWSLMLLGFGALSCLGLILIFTSLKIADNAPLVSAVFQLQTILAVLFGIIILKERKNIINKIVGSVVATIGAVMVVLG